MNNIPAEIGIYKITSPSGKVYIGQSWDIKQRKKKYSSLNNSAKQKKLQASFLKYGVKNHKFEVVYTFPFDISQEILDSYEIFFIAQYKDSNHQMLNIKNGGMGGRLPKESIEKMLKTRGKWHHTEETKNKISFLAMGRTLPPKYIYKIIDKYGREYSTTSIHKFTKEHNIFKNATHLYKSIKTGKFIKGFLIKEKHKI